MSANIPNWIQCSPHINTLRTLASRERQRDGIRTVSRHRSHQLVAATASLQNTELVDHYSVTAGCKNQYGNRYMDIEPYDRTRVVVGVEEEQRVTGASDAPGRYLNASWVRELFGGKWWIATQAPLPTTAHTFLSILLQPLTRPPQSLDPSTPTSPTCRIRTVVQLTQNVESGRQKAHAYFPYVDGQAWIVPSDPGSSTPIKVTLLETQRIPEIHSIQSMVSIVPISSADQEQAPITFRHILYTAWPDHGVPEHEDRASLLALIRLIDRVNKDTSYQPHSSDLHPDPPIMVNCSAGIGRTGSFIGLASLLRAYNLLVSGRALTMPSPASPLPASPLGPLPDDIKDDLLALEIDSLREQRPGMVQRDEQIMLMYEVLAAAFS